MGKVIVWIVAVALLCGLGIYLRKKVEQSSPRVRTSLGQIEGYYKTSNHGRRYEAYEGIPYAHPPTGKLRFRVSKPIPPWNDVLMAKQFSSACLQYDQFPVDPSKPIVGSEDCLYINVYTVMRNDRDADEPSKENRTLQPVIFYIHGGGFQYGTASTHRPEYLLDRNVTLVTFNYRLGPLGFLSTENDVVPGNMGLKDQVIAMRWVKDNIESFGGDPSRITIFGNSAGGASVHYQYLTKLTKGLFRGGMSLSGTALDCWAQTENSLEKAKKLASLIECPTQNIKAMVNCLRDRPARRIVEAVGKMMVWLNNPNIPFGPVVEKKGSEFTFIDRSPIEIITSGEAHDVPWITGVVSEEGLCQAANFVAKEELLEQLNDNWETIGPHFLDFNYTIPKSDHRKVLKMIKEHYLGTKSIDRSTVKQIIQMVGDRMFVYGAQDAARQQAQANRSPVRFYYFTYRGAQSESTFMSGSTEDFGVSHEDDLAYVLGVGLDPTTTPQDREMQKKLIDLWVSFATEGTPNVGIEWPKVSQVTEEFRYLHIAGPEEISTNETTPNSGEKNFWHSVGFHENIL